MSRKLAAVTVVLTLFVSAVYASDTPRVSATEKGSVLIFPKIELRYDAAGNLIQDTFIDLANDYNEDVWILAYFVSEACNWVDNDFVLTHNEPCYWSVATGLPKGLSPWTVLGDPYPDPSGSGDMVMRGYIVLWAINPDHQNIRWNHLYGQATIVNYANSTAWEYNAYAFQVVDPSFPNGGVVTTDGTINLDGVTYDAAFNKLLLDFFASGSTAFSGGGRVVSHDTDLTLVIVDIDLQQEPDEPNMVPYVTKADFEIWNENEVSFSGQEFCLTKWDQQLLSDLGGHFLIENLQTNKGRARIDGVGSPLVCGPASCDYAILGVAAKVLTMDGVDVAMAGTNLVGTGTESTSIYYDVPEPPEEKLFNGRNATPLPKR
jgi:hypothetical protein